MLGVYPVGTLLKLDNNELALVISSHREKDQARPLAAIMKQDADGNYIRGETIDLSKQDKATGNYERQIIETYHPSTFGIQPVQLIFPGT